MEDEKQININDLILPLPDDAPKTPFELFGVECNKGWYPLILPILEYIQKYNNSHENSKIYVDQVKEKWARLEIYVSFDNVPDNVVTETYDMIRKAQEESLNVCEECGTKENVGMNMRGWYYVVCEDCLKKQIQKDVDYYGKDYTYKTIRYWKRNDGKTFKITPEGITDWDGKTFD